MTDDDKADFRRGKEFCDVGEHGIGADRRQPLARDGLYATHKYRFHVWNNTAFFRRA